MTYSRSLLSCTSALLTAMTFVTPAMAAYRGYSHDSERYDSSGTYHASVDRLGGTSVCTAYDEQGRCLRTQRYRNTDPYALDRTQKKTSCTTQRRMDHTYVNQYGERQYDPRFYRVYDCGTQFRPQACSFRYTRY